jgi:hypothetical protein
MPGNLLWIPLSQGFQDRMPADTRNPAANPCCVIGEQGGSLLIATVIHQGVTGDQQSSAGSRDIGSGGVSHIDIDHWEPLALIA